MFNVLLLHKGFVSEENIIISFSMTWINGIAEIHANIGKTNTD
jgi:hypothetical protein